PPCSAARNARASSRLVGPDVPARMGTPARSASARARVLSPKVSSTSAAGPTKTRPWAAQRRANSARPPRNPYPGWMASQPPASATANDLLAVEVGRGPSASQRTGLVRPAHVKRRAVVLGEDRHGPELLLGEGARDAHGDLPTVRDQDRREPARTVA